MRDLVVESGADQDGAVVELAQRLLAAVDSDHAKPGTYQASLQATAKDHGRVYQAGRDQQIRER